MALRESRLGRKKLSPSKVSPNGAAKNNGKPSSNGQNGDCPFTEEDAKEVFEDRYDFFRNELQLPHDQAIARAEQSTNAWKREIFGERRE